MADFLLELLSEEIPARMQDKARGDLARLFADALAGAGLAAGAIETFATPRRLALIARDLPPATAAVAEEIKGPRADAPPQALAGFLGKTGLTREQLIERTDARGNAILFAVIERPGRATADVMYDVVPQIVRAFPWPKSMRWGAASIETTALRWVRPLAGIVALLDREVVPLAIDGIAAGAETVGHRFHHPGIVTVGGAADYAAELRVCHVIVDQEERRAIIREGAAALAAGAGLSLIPDEGLVAENAGLTEWPVPLLGGFDPAFLDVPREVIQLTMRTNQKYFALADADGRLAPHFVCTANIAPVDGGAAIVAGNRKVLSARLADAKFFWEQDLRVPLADQAARLDRILFHEKLGTVADKVERVARLARWLVEEGIVRPPLPPAGGAGGGHPAATTTGVGDEREPTPDPSREREGDEVAHLASLAEQAARLCKADLVAGLVGEFPELQGVVGGYLAARQGLDPHVAAAIRDHYKPVGQGDEVPTAPVTVAVSLADKLDTVGCFFTAEMPPTGSRDPFALRRAALSAIQLIFRTKLRLPLLKAAELIRDLLWQQREIAELERDSMLTNVVDEALDVVGAQRESLNTRQGLELALLAHPNIELLNSQSPLHILDFFADRLKVQQREAGVRHDLIDAVFALGGEDDLVRLLARVRALQAFVATEDGVNLLAGYKRAANILRIEERKGTPAAAPAAAAPAEAEVSGAGGGLDPGVRRGDGEGAVNERFPTANQIGYEVLPEESALLAALEAAEPAAARAVEEEDFAGAMRALAGLRGPIDAFFDGVTVNDPDPARRAARLGLLARIRAAVHRVADFSKIEG